MSVSVIGSLADSIANAIFSAAGSWVAGGAQWLLDQVGSVLSATTTIDLSSGWFTAHYEVMVAIAAAVVLPMALAGLIQAVYRQDASVLLRSFFVNLPLAMLFAGVAVGLVHLSLAVTDSLCATVAAEAGVDLHNILDPIGVFLVGGGVSGPPAVPGFVVFVAGLLVAVCAFVLWLELVVRSAAVSLAVMFLPLALAALVWPAVSHWCRRLVDTLVALICSKFVVVVALSLAAGEIGGGTGGTVGFGDVVTGIALLLLAIFSPFTLLRLIPVIESGAVSHLEASRHRIGHLASAPLHARDLALRAMANLGPDASVPQPGTDMSRDLIGSLPSHGSLDPNWGQPGYSPDRDSSDRPGPDQDGPGRDGQEPTDRLTRAIQDEI